MAETDESEAVTPLGPQCSVQPDTESIGMSHSPIHDEQDQGLECMVVSESPESEATTQHTEGQSEGHTTAGRRREEQDGQGLAKDSGEQKDCEGQEEEEMGPPEMTQEEKEAMYECVKVGDVDLLDDLLDLPGADINTVWFGENLLMAAIRAGQQEMAEFLIDNGVDTNFTASCLDRKSNESCLGHDLDWYCLTCRQMAYDYKMADIVDLIDEVNGNTWSFIKPRERSVRLKRPLEDKLREREEREREEQGLSAEPLEEERAETQDGRGDQPSSITAAADGKPSNGKGSSSGSTETNHRMRSRPATTTTMRGMSSGYESLSSLDSMVSAHSDHASVTPRNRYRSNRTFLSRWLSNNATYRGEEQRNKKTEPESLRQWSSMNSYVDIVDHIKADQLRTSLKAKECRVLSPWKQDDITSLGHLKRRAKSAPSSTPKAAVSRPYSKQLPLEESVVTHLPKLEDVLRKDNYTLSSPCVKITSRKHDEKNNLLSSGVKLYANKPISGSTFMTPGLYIEPDRHKSTSYNKKIVLSCHKDRGERATRAGSGHTRMYKHYRSHRTTSVVAGNHNVPFSR